MPFTFTEENIRVPFRHPLAVQNEVDDGPGIQGTMCVPSALDTENKTRRRQNRVVVMVHGHGGHRDYIYQKSMAHRLATEHGLWVFRYDGRNYGESQDVDGQFGYTSQAEIADISTVVQYIVFEKKLSIAAMITHSRSCPAVVTWALLQQTSPSGIYVPTIITFSARFRTTMVLDYMDVAYDGWRDQDVLQLPGRRFGKRALIPSRFQEYVSFSGYDMDLVKYLRPDTHVLVFHGTHDDIAPVEDAHIYHQLLGEKRSTLKLVDGADHNYFLSKEKSKVGGEGQKRAPNAFPLVVDTVAEFLAPEQENERFYKAHAKLRNHRPRFVQTVDKAQNLRDVGDLPSRTFCNGKRQWVKTGLIYRSAKLDNVVDAQQVADLGIKQVFDLRSDIELAPNDNTPDGLFHGPGITTNHIPLFDHEAYSPVAIAKRYQTYAANGFMKAYSSILEVGASRGFKQVFEYLRDNPGQAILFNCTAGKDRTGVLTMLILLLLGVDHQLIAHEYELTARGNAAENKRILAQIEQARDSSTLSENKLFDNISPQGFLHLLSSRFETMLEVIDMFNRKYGGIEHYLVNVMGLAEKDLQTIRNNLLWDGVPKEGHKAWNSQL